MTFATTITAVRLVQVTDIHYDSLYAVGSSSNCTAYQTTGCCRTLELPLRPTHPASPMGEYTCDSPVNLVREAARFIASLDDIDFVVFNGDSVDHHSFGDTWAHNLDEIATVAYTLANSSRRVYPVLGNHDTYPIDQMYPANCSLAPCYTKVLNDIADIWCRVYDFSDDMCTTFRRGGYYADNNVIVLNSLWWDRHNIWPSGQPKDDMIAWFMHELAKNSSRLLLAHIPPGASEVDPAFTSMMVNLNITYQMYGHSHMDTFRFVGPQVAFIAPSVVPSQHFPAIRVWTCTYSALGCTYEQYAANISSNNATFVIQYTTDLYDIDASMPIAEAWTQLYKQLETNATMMDMFVRNYYWGYDAPCDAACRQSILNDMNFYQRDEIVAAQ